MQGDADFNGLAGLSKDATAVAFDELLNKKQVLAIAGLFIKKQSKIGIGRYD